MCLFREPGKHETHVPWRQDLLQEVETTPRLCLNSFFGVGLVLDFRARPKSVRSISRSWSYMLQCIYPTNFIVSTKQF
jgi:hypothetical protein